jgi:hypothetical protein
MQFAGLHSDMEAPVSTRGAKREQMISSAMRLG